MPIVTAQERVGTTLAKKYRLDRILGEGGMGVVYAGHHVRLDRKVAVKFLHTQYAQDTQVVARFLSEAQAVARMQHPNVVDVYDVDQTDDDSSVYMVLEYLEGESLSAFLRARGRIPFAETIHLITPVLDALERAHENGIIHRDLKPDNLFLMKERNGTIVPKVLDFGIAKLAGATSGTSTGQIVGTPAYMAPEQAMGRKDIGPWTDVWSMGVVLYEMFSGRYPFDFTEDMPMTAMVVTVVTTNAHPLAHAWPEAPAHIAQCIDRALAKAPTDRWQSMTEFRAALHGTTLANQATLRDDSARGMRLTPPSEPRQPPLSNIEAAPTTPFGWASNPAVPTAPIPQKSLMPLVVGGAIVVVLAIGGFFAMSTGGGEPREPHITAAGDPPDVDEPIALLPVDAAVAPEGGTAVVLAAPPLGVELPIEPLVPATEHTPRRTGRRDRTTDVVTTTETGPDTTTTHRETTRPSWGTTVSADDM